MVSVIIPTMWVPQTFVSQLQRIIDNGAVSEVIIINNNVSNTPKQLCTGHNVEKIVLLNQKENIFVNPAWNLGVQTAKENAICILNDDLVFDTKIFYVMTEEFLKDKGVFGIDMVHTELPLRLEPLVHGAWPFGYGCMMFLHKEHYYEIPKELKIMWGDTHQLTENQDLGNYIIRGLNVCNVTGTTWQNEEVRKTLPFDQMYNDETAFWNARGKS